MNQDPISQLCEGPFGAEASKVGRFDSFNDFKKPESGDSAEERREVQIGTEIRAVMKDLVFTGLSEARISSEDIKKVVALADELISLHQGGPTNWKLK